MKLLSILKEIFDNPYSFTGPADIIDDDTQKATKYKFVDNNREEYTVYFNSDIENKKWITDISYYMGGDMDASMTNKYDVKVLSTVAAIVMDYIKKYQPEKLKYTGIKEDEENLNQGEMSKRAKINKAMINKFASKFPDYKAAFDGSVGTISKK